MPIVRNDIDAMSDLIQRLQQFRSAAMDGEERLRQKLMLEVGASWRDSRFDAFQDDLNGDLNRWRVSVDEEIAQLQSIAERLRQRLEEYLYGGSGVASAPSAIINDDTGKQTAALTNFRRQLFPASLPHDAPALPKGLVDAAKKFLMELLTRMAEPVARGLAMALLAKLGLAPPLSIWGLLKDPLLNFVLSVLGSASPTDASVIVHLQAAAESRSSEVRVNVVRAAARRRDAESAAILQTLANDPEPAVRRAARDAQIRLRVSDDAKAVIAGTRTVPPPASVRRRGTQMRTSLAQARRNQLQPFAALDAEATVEQFVADRSSTGQIQPASQAATPVVATQPPPLASQKLLRSFRADGAAAAQLAQAPNAIVRASATCAASLHARSSPRAATFAANAVESARETTDRGLLVAALLARAATDHAALHPAEALAACQEAEETWAAMSAAERLDWEAEPLEETLFLARATVQAGLVAPDSVNALVDLVDDVRLLLLRRCAQLGGAAFEATFLSALIDFLISLLAFPALTVAELQQRMDDRVAVIHHLASGDEIETFVITARRVVFLRGDPRELFVGEKRELLHGIDTLGLIVGSPLEDEMVSLLSDRYALFVIDSASLVLDAALAEDFHSLALYDVCEPTIDSLRPVAESLEARLRALWDAERRAGATAVRAFASAQAELRAAGTPIREWSAFRLRGDWRA